MSGKNKNNESPTIERVFELLDKWRHLPTYRLEPRADIFFALFLPEVLGVRFDMKINPLLVPNFRSKRRKTIVPPRLITSHCKNRKMVGLLNKRSLLNSKQTWPLLRPPKAKIREIF